MMQPGDYYYVITLSYPVLYGVQAQSTLRASFTARNRQTRGEMTTWIYETATNEMKARLVADGTGHLAVGSPIILFLSIEPD